ncbi:MAG: hypothetical protein AUJ57_03925 [Zetaproteobacteria bacterium CG1_02_53_45]|nr:MAG: hypothetical protein AUJ57_03925 [Zetaproteobacteria bacterium CG1_02_53_45]
MNFTCRNIVLISFVLMLSACSSSPKLFWDTEEGLDQSARSTDAGASGSSEVLPEVTTQPQGGRELPMAQNIGGAEQLPGKYSTILAGSKADLNSRSYGQTTGDLFSATVDAMVSLNYPVDVVDSSGGVVTSDWIRKGENNPNMPSVIGYTRHRYIAHIYHDPAASSNLSKLDVYVLGQVFENGKWTDTTLQYLTEELYSAVNEYLARLPH